MYSMGDFTLDIALDTLYYGLLELMSAREELFINDFLDLINEMRILDDEIESWVKSTFDVSRKRTISRPI